MESCWNKECPSWDKATTGHCTEYATTEVNKHRKCRTFLIEKKEPVADFQCSAGLANFSLLALGTRFKYKEGETVWVKIGADLVAEWDAKQIATKWVGQSICSATENGEEIEVRIVG